METPQPKSKRAPSAYNIFMKDMMSKRPSEKMAKEYMKEIAMKWKEQKNKMTTNK